MKSGSNPLIVTEIYSCLFLLFLVGEIINKGKSPTSFKQKIIIIMKRVYLILMFGLLAFTANSQQRINPMLDITPKTYEEAIELLMVMDRTMLIERLEGIRLKNDHLTTHYGEIDLIRNGGNSVRISIAEFTDMLNDHISYPSRRIYEISSIQTELILQTTDLYKYMSKRLMRNNRIRSMRISIDERTGGAYIEVIFHRR